MPIYGENAKNCDVRRGNSGSGVTAVGGSEDGQLVAALSMEINYRDSEGEKTFPDFFTPKLMPDYHAQYEEMRGSSEKQTRWHGLSVQLGCFEIESAESSNGTNWKIIYREQVQSCSYESIDLERVMDLEMVSNELVKSIGLSDTTKEGEEEVFKEASDLSQGVFRFESDGDRSPINLSGPRGPMNFYSYIPSCYDKDKIEELAESAIDSEAETFSIPLVLPGSVGEIYIDQSLKDFRYRHQSWSTKEVKVFDVYIEDKELSDLVTKAEEDINSETGLEACE
jgi:hypothetical protein